MVREERESLTDIRDFTVLCYVTFSDASLRWESSIESDSGILFALCSLDLCGFYLLLLLRLTGHQK